jgi:hypothetical protein
VPLEECPLESAAEQRQELEDAIRSAEAKLAQSQSDEEKARLRQELEELKRKLESLKPGGAPYRRPAPIVELGCGLALDCLGNELLLERPRRFDLWKMLSDDERRRSHERRLWVYVSLCFCEQPEEPQRPVIFDDCGFTGDTKYGWTREGVRVVVSVHPPKDDDRCEPCCTPCCPDEEAQEPCGNHGERGHDCCVLLARVLIERDTVVNPAWIDMSVRRPLTTYVTTKISGINWVHGAKYSREQIDALIGTEDDTAGLVVEFTRDVHVATVQEGVFDLWRLYGGAGGHADIKHVDVGFVGLPSSGYVRRVTFRNVAGEPLNYGDRLLIQVRTNFLLDRCCRAVDGEHIGGRVPLLQEFLDRNKEQEDARPRIVCPHPPMRPGPWTSGNGSEGGEFISWLWCKDREYRPYREATR